MEAQRFSNRSMDGTDAPSAYVHLNGVPVPSRVLGFSAPWLSAEPARATGPVAEKRSQLRLLRLVEADASPAPAGERSVAKIVAA